MQKQMSLFDGAQSFVIDKPIRFIAFFAGYGSQELALKYLDVPFEYWKISEWAIKSIQAYKDMHFPDDDTDYSKALTVEQLRRWLVGRISADYSTPCSETYIKRLSESAIRTIYNNMKATHNLGSITEIHGADLEIVDADKYTYIASYSFPCQDLSTSGRQAGMQKGSGTRSGLLWELERILLELSGGGYSLPRVLLMENVPQVIGKKFGKDFAQWLAFLEGIGYKCYWKVLNAKDYAIPQNRERCFMVSILGDYDYVFPEEFALEKRLKDLLENDVADKYYLSDKTVEMFIKNNEKQAAKGNGFKFNPTMGGGMLNVSSHEQEVDRTTTSLSKRRIKSSNQRGGGALTVQPKTTVERITVLVTKCGTKLERVTDCASTIMARDYKGPGNQVTTAVVERKSKDVTV